MEHDLRAEVVFVMEHGLHAQVVMQLVQVQLLVWMVCHGVFVVAQVDKVRYHDHLHIQAVMIQKNEGWFLDETWCGCAKMYEENEEKQKDNAKRLLLS